MQQKRAVLWSGMMAALIGRETIARDRESPHEGRAYLDRLLSRLQQLLGSELTAPERADAGGQLPLGRPRRSRRRSWLLLLEFKRKQVGGERYHGCRIKAE